MSMADIRLVLKSGKAWKIYFELDQTEVKLLQDAELLQSGRLRPVRSTYISQFVVNINTKL